MFEELKENFTESANLLFPGWVAVIYALRKMEGMSKQTKLLYLFKRCLR